MWALIIKRNLPKLAIILYLYNLKADFKKLVIILYLYNLKADFSVIWHLIQNSIEEFDHGSDWTLAVTFKHASRAVTDIKIQLAESGADERRTGE